MKLFRPAVLMMVWLGALLLCAGCGKRTDAPVGTAAAAQRHEHKPPHDGTPVVLGDEAYHLELVLDGATGTLRAYVFDGEMENFIRITVPAIAIEVSAGGVSQTLVLNPVANSATGETIGDTSLFEGQADRLKAARDFDGMLKSVTIRGATFTNVKFNFPKGNEKD